MPLPASRTPPLAARAVPRGRVYAKCRLAIGRQGGGRRDGTRRCVLEGSRGAAGLRGTGTARAAGPGARWKSPGCLGGRRDGVSGAAPRMPRPRAGGGGAATASGRFRLGYMGTENAAAGCTPPPARRWQPPPAWVRGAGWVRGGCGAGRGARGPAGITRSVPSSPAGLRRWLSSRAPAPRICVVGSGPAGFYTAQHILKVAGPGLGPPR